MSEHNHRSEMGNEADDSQGADARLLFARILERLDRLEKKIDAMGNNRPRQPWSGNGGERRPGGFSRPFKPSGFHRGPGGPNRFDGARGPRPHQGHGKPFQSNRPQNPR